MEPGFRVRGGASYPKRLSVEKELTRVLDLYASTVKAVHALFRPLEGGATVLEGASVRAAVRLLADSVIRNPEALLLLSRTREASGAAHARALQVSIWMMVFARFLQLGRDEIELLGLLGLLQDIGKTRLPAALLEKQAPLTPWETHMARKHVELSGHILGATRGLPPVLAELALLHHERQDGSGYPRGLQAHQIGLYGSIAAICDTYDALTAERPYAGQLSPGTAIQVLLQERGSALHAGLVDQFVECVSAFPVGSVVELSTGEVGVVVAANPGQRLRPVVRLALDPGGERLKARKTVDLERSDSRIRRSLEQRRLRFDPLELFQ